MSEQPPLIVPSTMMTHTIGEWDLFGNRSIKISFYEPQRIPNRWIRFWTKVFFNSKWELYNN